MRHAKKQLALGVMRRIESFDPNVTLTVCESLSFYCRNKRGNIHTTRRGFSRKSIADTAIQKRRKFSVIDFSDGRMSRRKVVSSITALIEEKKAILGYQIELQAEVYEFAVLQINQVLFFKIFLKDLINNRQSKISYPLA
ncbi:MAG: hypothetical protein ACREFE_04565 [Limisphaerales bacterium]